MFSDLIARQTPSDLYLNNDDWNCEKFRQALPQEHFNGLIFARDQSGEPFKDLHRQPVHRQGPQSPASIGLASEEPRVLNIINRRRSPIDMKLNGRFAWALVSQFG